MARIVRGPFVSRQHLYHFMYLSHRLIILVIFSHPASRLLAVKCIRVYFSAVCDLLLNRCTEIECSMQVRRTRNGFLLHDETTKAAITFLNAHSDLSQVWRYK